MQRYEARAQVAIAADAETIWNVLTHFVRYPEWNPFLRRVTVAGDLAVGTRVRLEVAWSSGRKATALDVITAFSPPNGTTPGQLDWRFAGRMARLGLLSMHRRQRLTQSPHGCLYETWEQGDGLLVGMVPFAAIRDGFQRHVQALKKRCEAPPWAATG